MRGLFTIHIKTNKISDKHIEIFFSNVLGSKYFQSDLEYFDEIEDEYNAAFDAIATNSPRIQIGEVSWMMAAILGDMTYIPVAINNISKLIGEDLPILNKLLINKIIYELVNDNSYTYDIENIKKFLYKYERSRCFTVTW